MDRNCDSGFAGDKIKPTVVIALLAIVLAEIFFCESAKLRKLPQNV